MINGKEVFTKQTESVEEQKIDNSIFKKRSNAKTSSGIVLGYMKKLKNSGAGLEYLKLLESLYKEIKNLETSEKIRIIKMDFTKQEINRMIVCINKLKEEYNNKMPSRQLGEEYFHGNWDYKVFSKRSIHHKFTHLLNILDYYQIIKYNRAGFTTIIKEVREIQEVLK